MSSIPGRRTYVSLANLMARQIEIKVVIEQKTRIGKINGQLHTDDERIRKLYGQQKCQACTFATLKILSMTNLRLRF